jgi:N-acetylglutamate synthase-like GNAT family acetyltransferase
VIRSVVVDPAARGQGIGVTIAERLIAAARIAGATDLYLFTEQAHPFWLRLGFADVTFEDWKAPARANWQYQFLSQNRTLVPDLHTMWRRLAGP